MKLICNRFGALLFVAGAMAFNGVAWGQATVLAWGLNSDGQCTIPLAAQSGVSAIAGGGFHTIALKDGAVMAWGLNDNGQCTVPDSANSGVTAIAGGFYHTVALKDGAVLAWGAGTTNQTNGGSSYSEYGQCIIPDSAKSGVTAIAAGQWHTIVLKDGAVLAWGYNGIGQCTIPLAAQSGVTAIAGGNAHTIALKDGAVMAWGWNAQGQLNIPAAASSGVTAIAGGGCHTIALKGGAVLAWDYNGYGQCTIPDSALSGVSAIAGGHFHTIALTVTDPNDIDCDGIPNATDNCPSMNNPTQADCDGNGVGDACELDCNHNGLADVCEIGNGTTSDCNNNHIPDSCDFISGVLQDCNHNGLADVCEILSGAVTDQNLNGIPDTCEVSSVSGVVPVSGPSTGGTAVKIIGTNFFSALPVSVTFGGAPATNVVVVSLTEIRAVTPAGTPGMAVVTVNSASSESFYYRPSCDGDLDNNGTIDSSDLGLVLLGFGSCSESLTTPQPEPLILQSVEPATPALNKK